MRKYEVIEYDIEDYDDYRDNITKEQIIERLREIERFYLADYNFTCSERDFELYTLHIALYCAIEIIEQINGEVSLNA